MSDIIEEMGGYMGNGSEFEQAMEKDNLSSHANGWRPGDPNNLAQENGLSQIGPSEYAHTPALGSNSMYNAKSSDPMDNLEVGMVLEHDDFRYERCVKSTRQETVVELEDLDDGCINKIDLPTLKEDGWHVRQTQTELTRQQIADKFGVPVETLRIKE